MKKIMSIGLAFCIIFSIIILMPIQAQAAGVLEMSTGGSVSKVTYSQNNSIEEIRIYSSSTKILKQDLMPPEGSAKNYRLRFEIDNADVSKSIYFDINKGTVVQIRMANMSDPKRVNVVVETTTKPVYTISTSSDGKSIVLTIGSSSSSNSTPSTSKPPAQSTTPTPTPSTTPKPSTTPIPANNQGDGNSNNPIVTTKNNNGPLSISMSGDTCTVNLKGISLTQAENGNIPRFELREKEKILQITIPGKDTRFTEGFLNGNSIIYGALVNYNVKQNSTIIRIPYNNTITYSHTVSGGNSIFLIKAGNTSVPVNTPAP